MTEHESQFTVPEGSVRPYYDRKPGVNVDPVDVAAGMAMLEQTGHASRLTQMVIEHSLQLWARGEEHTAEKKAIDKSFNGIDMTSWRMVLAAAVAAGQKKLEGQDVEPAQRPGDHDLDPKAEATGQSTDDIARDASEDDVDEAARAALLHDRPWEDGTAIDLPGTAVPAAEGVVVLREATAQDVIMMLLKHHCSDGRSDCGARTPTLPCDWTRGRSAHPRHCTLEPGHDGPHKDALHCWSFETFDETRVERYEPRDLARCKGCGSSPGFEVGWPCNVAKEALEIARQLGIQIPPEYV